jgi:hypothetical protein
MAQVGHQQLARYATAELGKPAVPLASKTP